MITGVQIRAARSALRWTTQELADRAGLTSRTVKRFEAVDSVPPSHSSTLGRIKFALEAAGIEFIGTPTDRPGIRLLKPREGAVNEEQGGGNA
jgi:transcriptional regulator with XRE-family HTH domain